MLIFKGGRVNFFLFLNFQRNTILCVYVCMCVCVCVYMCVYMCMYVCVCVYSHISKMDIEKKEQRNTKRVIIFIYGKAISLIPVFLFCRLSLFFFLSFSLAFR